MFSRQSAGNVPTTVKPGASGVRLGLRENWRQFALLVLVNAFIGGMVGGAPCQADRADS